MNEAGTSASPATSSLKPSEAAERDIREALITAGLKVKQKEGERALRRLIRDTIGDFLREYEATCPDIDIWNHPDTSQLKTFVLDEVVPWVMRAVVVATKGDKGAAMPPIGMELTAIARGVFDNETMRKECTEVVAKYRDALRKLCPADVAIRTTDICPPN